MTRVLSFILLFAAGPVAAQAPATVDVALSSFKFAPATIRLHHGQRYVLRLTNTAGGAHDFSAEKFFSAAQVVPDAPVRKGSVEVGGGETVTIALTAPAAGTYPVRCTHFMHTAFGMKAAIVVD